MLQAHSFLWHYLWLAPHFFQLALALALFKRGIHRVYTFFFAYLIIEAFQEYFLYGLDLIPSVTGTTFWRFFLAGLVIEGVIKLAVIGEIFFHLLEPWPTIAKLGSRLISGTGGLLVLIASLAAAFVVPDNTHWIISGSHILQQSFYIVECGLLLFTFAFAAFFTLSWNRVAFGIAVGFAVLACEHLASWAMMASSASLERRNLLDFFNLATYHFSVLIWMYFLLVPQKSPAPAAVALPEHNLDLWNQELERLLQP